MEYYICAGITLVSAGLGVGFSITAILEKTGKNKQNAMYMFARSLALLGIAFMPIFIESVKILIMITGAMLVVQVIDGGIGIVIKSRMRTVGPFIMAAFHLLCLLLISFT